MFLTLQHAGPDNMSQLTAANRPESTYGCGCVFRKTPLLSEPRSIKPPGRACSGLSWLAVVVTVSSPSGLRPSHAQPLPNRAAAAALNFAFISSSDPNALSTPRQTAM